MEYTQIVQQYLPNHLRQIAQSLVIPVEFIQTNTDLIILLLESKALENLEEKQSWFNLLPLMNAEQIQKLQDILLREKQKLAEIEEKYNQKKQVIAQKYVQKFEEEEYQNRLSQMRSQEAQSRLQEHQEAENLLTQL